MADNFNSRSVAGTSTSTTTTTTHGPVITTTTTIGGPHPHPHTIVTSDAPQSTTIAYPTVVTTYDVAAQRPPAASSATQTERQPSIRIRRQGNDQGTQTIREVVQQHGARRRSSSEPQRPQAALLQPHDDLEIQRQMTATPLQTLHEEGAGVVAHDFSAVPSAVPPRNLQRPGWGRGLSAISLRSRVRDPREIAPEYDAHMVDMLDVIGKP